MFIKYRADIDGLRAIAVISVMLYHLLNNLLPGGFIGVDVFFVISGFVVTSSLSQNQSQSLWSFITLFYARRLARIMPALLLTLLATAITATLMIPNAWLSQFSQETARFAFFGLSNWKLQTNLDAYFAPRAEYNPYTHTWSLGIEEQFYLIVPVIIYFWINAKIKTQKLSQFHVAIGLILLALLSLASCIWTSNTNTAFSFYSIAARFWELALGSILFLLTSPTSRTLGFKKFISNKIQVLGAPVGLIILTIGLFFSNGSHFPWPWALLPVIGTLLLICGAHTQPTDPTRKVLACSLFVWIGKRSYSLYLWHWPVYVLLRWTTGLNTSIEYIAALAITLLLAIFSYRYIEQPFRHNTWMEKRSPWMVVLIFLILTTGCSLVARYIFKHSERYSLSVVMQHQQDWFQNSLVIYPNMGSYECLPERSTQSILEGHITHLTPKTACGQNQPASKQLFVLGDSHAEALFPTIEALSSQFSLNTYIYAQGGCSFIDLKKPMAIGISPACNQFNRSAQEDVFRRAHPGDLVILPSLRMERFTDQWANFNIGDMHEKMYGPQAMLLRKSALADAKQWLKIFSDAKLTVILVAPPPILKSPTFRCSDWFNQTNPVCQSGLTVERTELLALRSPILQELNELSQALPNVFVWDPFLALCPEKICSSHRDAMPLFFDGDHISNYGNFIVYENLRDWLSKNRMINKD